MLPDELPALLIDDGTAVGASIVLVVSERFSF
jgi:hypothetical protein